MLIDTTYLRLGLFLLIALGTIACPAQQPLTKAETVANLKLLTSAQFGDREQATQQLLQTPESELPLLKATLQTAEADGRHRLKLIIALLEKNIFDRAITEFAKDVQGASQATLPGWTEFQQLVGNSIDARQLFVAMQRAEPRLLAAYQESPAAGQQQLIERITTHYSELKSTPGVSRTVSFATLASLWFVSQDEKVQLDTQLASLIVNLYYQVGSNGISENAVHRKLFSCWLQRTFPAEVMAQLQNHAREAGMTTEAIMLAKKVLADNKVHGSQRIACMQYIVKELPDQAMTLLEPLLQDTSVAYQFFPNNRTATERPREPYKVQVRDLALIYLLDHCKQEPKLLDLKFELPLPDPKTGRVDFQKLLIDNEDQRDQMHIAWNTWWQAHRAEYLQPAAKP